MAIVTVSHVTASGGALLAEEIAKKFGYKIVSREDIVHEAARFGVPEEGLKEALVKSPRFWERLRHERRRYLAFVQAALCEHAQEGGIVYHGNAGHLLLSGVSHVVCIRLIAPMSMRTQRVMERMSLNSEAATDYIEEMDRERQNWTRFLYGVDWLDPNLYDLTVNLNILKAEGALEVAEAAIRRPEFQPTDSSRKAMANLLLASRVRAALAADRHTASADVDVNAVDGVVYLKGKLRNASLVDQVMDVAGSVEGVQRLDREQLDALDIMV